MQSEKPLISVLLVDDQKFVGMAVQRLLAGEADIQLHCCDKALEAVDRANQIRPTVILQDLVLPDVDGVTMVGLFRANPTTASTAIIVLSGNDDAEVRSRAAAAGADDFMVKLPAKHELIGCIRRHAGARSIPAEAVAAPADVPATSSWETEETLDRSVMARYRQPEDEAFPDFLVGLIDRFIQEAERHVEMLRDAGQRKDADALTATAHSLKGSSMTMGANRLAALCGRVETHGKDDPSMLFTPDFMTKVDRELVNVRNALTLERQAGRQQ